MDCLSWFALLFSSSFFFWVVGRGLLEELLLDPFIWSLIYDGERSFLKADLWGLAGKWNTFFGVVFSYAGMESCMKFGWCVCCMSMDGSG